MPSLNSGLKTRSALEEFVSDKDKLKEVDISALVPLQKKSNADEIFRVQKCIWQSKAICILMF